MLARGSLALILACTAGPALAWDHVAHEITASIAWDRMSTDARREALRLLRSAPEDSDLRPSEKIKGRDALMFAAVWPDVVRDRDRPERRRKYDHPNWHYADGHWRQEGDTLLVLWNFEPGDGIATRKLAELETTLYDPLADDAHRAIALAWYLHIGGDLHNPVHTASRVTEEDPDGDRGGNRFALGETNLHAYWDTIAGDISAKKVTRKHPFADYSHRLALGQHSTWRAEGLALLPTDVYTPDLRRGRMPPESYEKRAREIALERLALAGYRLGETLNRALASPERR